MKDVMLANATFGYDVGNTGTFVIVHGVLDIGETGLIPERKEKTNLADTQKQYDAGIQDSPEKQIKGQVIPYAADGDEAALYTIQQQFFADCRAKKSFTVQITWEDGETDTYGYKSRGVSIDAPSSSEWKMFTVSGDQTSGVTTTPPAP